MYLIPYLRASFESSHVGETPAERHID